MGLPGASPTYRRLKPLLRHPVPVALYRALLPADLGFLLARWVNRRVSDTEPDAETIEAVRAHARAVLASTEAELAVLGHSHRPALCHWPEGTYLNPGSVGQPRDFNPRASYAVIEDGAPTIKRTNYDIEKTVKELQATSLPKKSVAKLISMLVLGGIVN